MKLRAFLAAAAAVCLAVPALPCRAQETFTYTLLEDGTAAVSCADPGLVTAEIPAQIDGHAVTTLAENCFDGCYALEEVLFPESLTTIGSYAFQNCVSLETITLPQSITFVDDFVFEGCPALREITVDPENQTYFSEEGVLFKDGISCTLLRYPAAREDKDYAVPENCGTVAPWAFTDCIYVKNVDLKNVDAIGADAFLGCQRLRSVQMSDSIRELIGATFGNCYVLRKIELPNKLQSIGDRCFFGCSEIKELNFPETLESVGDQAFFACVGIKDYTLPATLKTIGENALGFSVDEEGNTVKVPEVVFHVPFNSEAYRYARENGFAYKSEVPQSFIIMVIAGIVVTVALIFGIFYEIRRRREEKAAEAARLEEERRNKINAERRERRKKEKAAKNGKKEN